MNRDHDDDNDDNDLTEAVVAADDTGLVRNEIQIVEAEIEEAERGEWTTEKSPTKPA